MKDDPNTHEVQIPLDQLSVDSNALLSQFEQTFGFYFTTQTTFYENLISLDDSRDSESDSNAYLSTDSTVEIPKKRDRRHSI